LEVKIGRLVEGLADGAEEAEGGNVERGEEVGF
jgi:hypothetical protein